MEIKPGAKPGPYEILSRIGAGGMGQAWKARDTRLDRLVAIKTAHAKFSERFELDARAVAALSHPHICTSTTSVRSTWSWNTSKAAKSKIRCRSSKP
jgi:serine/threonine protein kinase